MPQIEYQVDYKDPAGPEILIERHPRLYAFGSCAEALRWIAANAQFSGWHRPVEDLHMSTWMGHEAYWFDQHHHMRMSQADYARLATVQQRYARLVRHLREVAPQWREVSRTNWADNSIDSHQVDKDGNTRTVQILGPSGDACF